MGPLMELNSVVFPAPFGPTIPMISPSFTVKVISSLATRPPNRFVVFFTSNTVFITFFPPFPEGLYFGFLFLLKQGHKAVW